ncbi:MAG: hypothetical protein ACK5MF_11555 [Vibrio sp.]|uniref:hypothetical protein n=1 Tax=Vibrio sp. TaxID=678 RepID=UPI003A8AEBC3
MTKLWYFARLGIKPTNDNKAIKRAYAVELKKIDQETQLQEFEKLREAYELARSWAEKKQDKSQFTFEPSHCEHTWHNEHFEQKQESNETQQFEELEQVYLDEQAQFRPVAPVIHANRTEENGKQTQHSAQNEQVDHSQSPPTAPIFHATLDKDLPPKPLSPAAQFQTFIEQVIAYPKLAHQWLTTALKREDMIALEARMEFEVLLANWLFNNHEGQPQLFEAAVELFEWQQHLPITQNYQVDHWLKQIVTQWLQWKQEPPAFRADMLKAINKHRMLATPKETQALSNACARYPLLSKLWQTQQQSEQLKSSAERKIIALRERMASSLRVKLLVIFCLWLAASMTIVGVMSVLNDHLDFDWQWNKSEPSIQRQPANRDIDETREKALKNLLDEEKRRKEIKSQSLPPRPKPVPKVTVNKPELEQSTTQNKPKQPEKKVKQPEIVVVSFNMSPELCKARAELVDRWADVYKHDVNYTSFRNEVQKCVDNRWWPKGKPTVQEYLQRLEAAWLSPYYPNNKLLEGLELEARHRAEDSNNDLVMLCDKDSRVNPFVFPSGARCVSLAATYKAPKIRSTVVTPEFCQMRMNATNWHFDQGKEWANYLTFRQEMTDCFTKGWWDRQTFKRDLQKLKASWREADAR